MRAIVTRHVGGFLPTCSALLLLGVFSLKGEEQRELLIVAGQSNAVGFDAPPPVLPMNPVDEKILFWWRCGDPPPDEHDSVGEGTWAILRPQPLGHPLTRAQAAAMKPPHREARRQYGNFAQPEGGFGPEMSFARVLATRESRPLAVLKVAFSGTSVATDWKPDGGGDEGACYRALVGEYRKAVAAAQAKGLSLRPRALVWVQGESDATAEHAPHYEANLRAMLGRLRADLESRDLVILLGVNTRFGNGKNPHMPAVVAAQQSVADTLSRCAYIDTSGAETLGPSHTHFTGLGTIEVGVRFANALLREESAVDQR